jgi:hypothetical protein
MGKEVRKAVMWKEKYGKILSKSSFRKMDVRSRKGLIIR